MCGIVGAIAERDIVPVLIEGLRRLEYRGYDSAGVAVLNGSGHLKRVRTVGKVQILQDAIDASPTHGSIGIAHTRWATHGVPSERNAHPHISEDGLAIVHNGIIENHDELRAELRAAGYEFTSETDTEVIAHRIHHHMKSVGDLFKAVRATVSELEGAYALAVVSESDPDRVILAREGCPVVIGLGEGENFVASDIAALLPVTRNFLFLEEGDVAEVRRQSVKVVDREGSSVERKLHVSALSADAAEKGQYEHFMLKEIHEQPRALADTLQERVANGRLLEAAFGPAASEIFAKTEHVHIVYELSRRLCRPLSDRAVSEDSLHRRDRERISLSQSGRTKKLTVCHDQSVWRNGRHLGCAASCETSWLSELARHLQCARKLARARIGASDAHASRP
jgi:glucosamine--fructose-6-phosphate aminotransferase (isomerizing)